MAWFVRYPGFEALRSVFAELLGGLMGPLAPGIAVPEELLEVDRMMVSLPTWLRSRNEERRAKIILRYVPLYYHFLTCFDHQF